MPFDFEYPFGPSKKPQWFCVCVQCGQQRAAERQISEYPFRFIPIGWSQSAKDGAVRCEHCTDAREFGFDWYHKNDVFLRDERYGGPGDGRLPPMLVIIPRDPMKLSIHQATEMRTALLHLAESQEKKPMEEKKLEKSKPRKHVEAAGKSVGLGLALAGVNEGGEIFLDIAKELSNEIPMLQSLLESPQGRELAKFLIASGIQAGCVYGDGFIPKAEFVGRVAGLQVSASTMLLAGPVMNKLRKHFQKLAGIGARIAGEEEPESEPEEERKSLGRGEKIDEIEDPALRHEGLRR